MIRDRLARRGAAIQRAAPAPRTPVAPSFAVPRAASNLVTVTWVGHSSCLVQIGGRNVLTDPVWSERASPFALIGPRRKIEPGVDFEALPPIDLVLISHNHYDHLDDRTVRRLATAHPTAHWFAPLGVADFLETRGVAEMTELDWWQETRTHDAHVACGPAQHFSGRGLRDRDATLWCSWVVEVGGRRMFFGGDTGYHPEFHEIGQRYGPFDVSILPIGAYEPRWFMRPVHMDPEEAVAAFEALGSSHAEAARRCVMVPIHWGTFKLTTEPLDEPPKRLRVAWERARLPGPHLWILTAGETRVRPALIP